MILTSALYFLVTAQISLCIRRSTGYSDSYVYLNVRNTRTQEQKDVCANYLQFKDRRIGSTVETGEVYSVKWWNNVFNRTQLCPLPSQSEKYTNGLVPLKYRIDEEVSSCAQQYIGGTAFKNATQFQLDQLRNHSASSGLFLVDKGRKYFNRWRDFLFSEFYDPYVNTSTAVPTYFVYTSVFNDILKEFCDTLSCQDLQLTFYRPDDPQIDLSMVFIWFIAMICVGGGGTWAYFRHKNGKDVQQIPPLKHEGDSTSTSWAARHSNMITIAFLMVVLISILMLGYFFRSSLVYFFNFLLMIFGTSAIYGCITALLSNFEFTKSLINHKLKATIRGKELPSFASMVICAISLAFCVNWFIHRKDPYAFIILDIINITLCLHILKSLRLPCLKWVATLMICMVIYDVIMVFGTPYFTKNGCSVMLEVAMGVDCGSKSATIGYPIPPIDTTQPEKFPMLMQVIHFDRMLGCYDLEIEKGYQMTILGLGDILIPGYLISHCFTMNGFTNSARIIYGTTCIISYGLGLIATFFALLMMHTAQPALIYLVPFTLGPICLLAVYRGDFKKIWNGVPHESSVLPEGDESQNTTFTSVPTTDVTSDICDVEAI